MLATAWHTDPHPTVFFALEDARRELRRLVLLAANEGLPLALSVG